MTYPKLKLMTFGAALTVAIAMTASNAVLAQLPLVNKGQVNPSSWVYGPRNDDTSGGLIWNPVKQKMINGDRVIGRTVSTQDLATMNMFYCSRASEPTADFTWTEMQHSGVDWGDAWRMWAYGSSAACPDRQAIPGVRVAYTDEREIQHALDGGAMVLVVPTVDTEDEAKEVVQWAYFPPIGRRSQGGSQTNAVLSPWIPTGTNYRRTFNNNLVLIVMIETIEGVKNVEKIAQVAGVDGVFIASSDLGNFSGYSIGDADYEKLVTTIHDATIAGSKRLCGPLGFQTRPDFTCFQQ
jgi:2-keto-3-deoxy-L-rhamnonate aldolase RhmA